MENYSFLNESRLATTARKAYWVDQKVYRKEIRRDFPAGAGERNKLIMTDILGL
jgi:hypothetical protein